MSTVTKPNPEKTFTFGEDEYHHHGYAGEVLLSQDTGSPVRAYCGAMRAAHPNPLELPCCPECRKHLKNPCVTQSW